MVINKKEKLLVEWLLADKHVFIQVLRILKPEYFSTPLDEVITHVIDYHSEHNGVPSVDVVEAETGVELRKREMDESERSYLLEELEQFCRQAAMRNALLASADLISDTARLQEVESLVREALLVRIDNSIGIDLFEGAEDRINGTEEVRDVWFSGIKKLDDLTGGLGKKELGALFASTGSGKSVMLANLTKKLALDGQDVLVVSLEMSQDMYAQRLDVIMTGSDIKKHGEMASEIAEMLGDIRETSGRITIKRLPFGTTVTDIRGVVMEYALMYGKAPDAIVIDYLALMGDGTNNTGKFDIMENVSFGIKDLLEEFDMRGITAGQLGRESHDVLKIRPADVAGGISLVNALDWAVGMSQSEQDVDNDQMQINQMKARSFSKAPDSSILYRCPSTLIIQDEPFTYEQKKNTTKNDTKGSSIESNTRRKATSKAKPTQEALEGMSGKDKLKSLLKM